MAFQSKARTYMGLRVQVCAASVDVVLKKLTSRTVIIEAQAKNQLAAAEAKRLKEGGISFHETSS